MDGFTGRPRTAPARVPPRRVRGACLHGKPVGAFGSGVGVVSALEPDGLRLSTDSVVADRGVVTDAAPGAADAACVRAFVAAIAAHRHRDRPPARR